MSGETLTVVTAVIVIIISVFLLYKNKQQSVSARIEVNRQRIREFQDLIAKAKNESTEALDEYNKKRNQYRDDFNNGANGKS